MKNKSLSLKSLALVICLLIGLISIAGANTIFTSAEAITSETSLDTYQSNVNRSVDLYEEVIKPYTVKTTELADREIVIYSEDYAGVFINEEGILNVGLVSDDSAIKTKQSASVYGDNVIYQNFAYSYNYLQEVMLAIESIMLDNNVLSVGIDDKYNNVFIELNSENDIAPIVTYLQKESRYEEDAVNFTVDPYAAAEDDSTAYGGESLSGGGFRGSICVNVIDNTTGGLGIITNEHVAPVGRVMAYRGHWDLVSNTGSVNVAMGTSLRAQNGGMVDAAFVPFDASEDWCISADSRYNTTTFSNVRLGNNNQIIRGQPVKRIGQTTGVTIGEIRSANATWTLSGTQYQTLFVIQMMVKAVIAAARSIMMMGRIFF